MSAKGKKRTCVHLSIKDKLELLDKLDKGYSVAKVCAEYGVKKQTVSDMRKAKDKLRAFARDFNVGASSSTATEARKHMKVCTNKDLEEAVYKWYI